jgi:hypothetical protein
MDLAYVVLKLVGIPRSVPNIQFHGLDSDVYPICYTLVVPQLSFL